MFWNKEKCFNEALKYEHKVDFIDKSSKAYSAAKRLNCLNEITEHMTRPKPYNKIWTKHKCQEEALKYKHKIEFKYQSSGAYNSARKNNWLDEITKHMIPLNSNLNRLIYIIEFPNKVCYIGLTYNFDSRILDHTTCRRKYKTTVGKYIECNNIQPILMKKLSKLIEVSRAIELEKYYCDEYKSNGYTLLNKIKTGGIGATKEITYEECAFFVKKYKSITAILKSEDIKYYRKIKRMKWNELISNFKKRSDGTTYEYCNKCAKKCKTRAEFTKRYSGQYNTSRINGWLNEICSHMNTKIVKKWDIFSIEIEAKKYETKCEFQKKSNSAYNAARRMKIFDEITKHMEIKWKPVWNYNNSLEEAKKYNTISLLLKNSYGCYDYAKRNGFIEEIKNIIKNNKYEKSNYINFNICIDHN